jgi:FtsP/CotA-like multicopper oxidase with cupredoxin domain
MSQIYLPPNASRARLREAERARQNRAEIVRELSWGRISRRELIKWGLFTGAGMLAPIGGLNPFVASVGAQVGPTGAPPSPLFGCKSFTQPMPRFDVIPRLNFGAEAYSDFDPEPQAAACYTQQDLDPALRAAGARGPIDGRPGNMAGSDLRGVWSHQRFGEFQPQVLVRMAQLPARTNNSYNPGVASSLNSEIDPTVPLPLQFHSGLPLQQPNSVWTFNGTIPPKLVKARYGEPVLFRHRNGLPFDVTQNNGFGRHTISTHEHNGHHGAENDGFTGAFFFPGQFYDYHWPVVLAGHFTVNTAATDPRASSPDDSGGLKRVPGDWRETMSTHWFHDHMFSFTAQNVYKGNAAMFNIYSGLDRGAEDINDGVNLRLPSGRSNADNKGWGALDYDVNLMLADKGFDRDGQLFFDIFEFDGFIGDVMTVNLAYEPYFEVERRKYRFRILNASVSRFFKIALADANGNGRTMTQIANDGNLLPTTVDLKVLDEQGIAERYDIVIDFTQFDVGSKAYLVNLADHFNPQTLTLDGRKPIKLLSLAQALAGTSQDPCVGKFLEFRIIRPPAVPDVSQVPRNLIPNPDLTSIPVTRTRRFEFGRGAKQPSVDPDTAFFGPWGIETGNESDMLAADYKRVSAAPKFGTREVWTLVNGGGGWDHPIHIHFEEGQVLARNGSASNVPAWEKGRKDVYRLRPGGSITITMQFRDWGGMFMEHCHNTMHEDNAMLLRWEINGGGEPFLAPLPTPIPRPTGVEFKDGYDLRGARSS